jgi:hypothetical protein
MSDCDCPDCRPCDCPECRTRRAGYSDNPTIDLCVQALVANFTVNAFCRVPHEDKTISGIRRIITTGWGKAAARQIRITCH